MPTDYSAAVATFNAYYAEIGKAVAAWARLETEIDKLLLVLLYHPAGKSVLRQARINPGALLPNSFSVRAKMWKRLARSYYDGAILDLLLDLISVALKLKPFRDRLAHGTWAIEHSARCRGEVVCYMYRHGIEEGMPITLEELRTFTRQSGETVSNLIVFHRDHHPEGPLPVRLRRFFESLAKGSTTQARAPKASKPPSRPRPSRE